MAKVTYKKYKCECCGNIQEIQTNHYGSCINYCNECSWKMNYKGKENTYIFDGHAYRKFNCIEEEQ
jgi:hypothetical protein